MGYIIHSNITCPNRRCYGQYWRSSLLRNLLNVKHPRTLKIDAIEIQDNKNIGKLFSKYELLFLDQTNSSSDASQMLIFPYLELPCLPYHLCQILAN